MSASSISKELQEQCDTMESIATIRTSAPPLPPKMRSRISISRDAPPASETSATVLLDTGSVTVHTPDVYSFSFPEVQGPNSSHSPLTNNHVVTIKINPENGEIRSSESVPQRAETPAARYSDGCIRINVGSNEDEMVQRSATMTDGLVKQTDRSNPYFFCSMVMSSGQCSPSDTLDSGTCSDLDSTPPPLPKKKNSGVTTVTIVGEHHKRAGSLTSSGADVDSDDNESNISCDSLNSSELNGTAIVENGGETTKTPSPKSSPIPEETSDTTDSVFPQGLLKDIRNHNTKQQTCFVKENSEILKKTSPEDIECKAVISPQKPTATVVKECTYEDRNKEPECAKPDSYETDKYYKFHLNEKFIEEQPLPSSKENPEDETFAGYKDILGSDGSSTIRSSKGTVRGVKNRVRAGIATFLQINSNVKNYKDKDSGKVVVYTTTMGIVRGTYHQCLKVKQILRTNLVKFEERDVFMSGEYQAEIRERMQCDQILVPQVFVDGQHIGDAETTERLNETGELRRILKPYKSADACTTCNMCGGYRLLPCPVCSGSKKSVHRNHFTTEFVALKCMNCDEVGLVRCGAC